jgi:hypothetical protein
LKEYEENCHSPGVWFPHLPPGRIDFIDDEMADLILIWQKVLDEGREKNLELELEHNLDDIAKSNHLAAEQEYLLFVEAGKRCLEGEKNCLAYLDASRRLFAKVEAEKNHLWDEAMKKWSEFQAEQKHKLVEAEKKMVGGCS